MHDRIVEKIVPAHATSDGDGVKISRSIGSRLFPQANPFLLLDELRSDDAADYIGGFPPHPHRGFETVTYMLEGQMRHKDSSGNEGVIRSGDVQWMTAGSGIIHSEMPEQNEGRLWGFQFWINLPASEKMRAPRYQEIASQNIPELALPQGKVRVIAGDVQDLQGSPVQGAVSDIITEPLLLDVQLSEGVWNTAIPSGHVAMVYVYQGELIIGSGNGAKAVQQQHLVTLSEGENLVLQSQGQPAGALVFAAAPIHEPVARSGPFVMNTDAEIQQAFEDYRSGNFASI
jgi:redox-sensitive bicupin YhaK (pirin superfamily)